jgi:hypothetical protein
MALMNTSIAYGTISPRTTQSEFISFTGITQNADGTATLTGVTRGLNKTYPYTEDSDFKLPHAGATQFILSDMPQVFDKYVSVENTQTISGAKTFSVQNAQTSAGNPVTDNEYARKAYVDAVATGGVSNNRTIVAGTAGETVAVDQLIYLKVSDGRWWLADADTASTVDNVILGIAQGAGTAGNPITSGVLTNGLHTFTSLTLTANTQYYASNTAGGFSSTPGTTEVSLGESQTTTTFLFYPRFDQQLTENQQDALAGTSGTPSATNKFVTNDDTATAATADKVARRLATGDITVPTTPTNATDAASKAYVDSKIPVPFFQQIGNANLTSQHQTITSADGSILIVASYVSAGVVTFFRYARDAVTNTYYYTGDSYGLSTTGNTASTDTMGMAIIGTDLYVCYRTATPDTYVQRLSTSNLAGGVTAITISGTKPDTGASNHIMYSNGTGLVIYSTGTTWYRYTISGTTITNAETLSGPNGYTAAWSDGVKAYIWNGTTLGRYALALGAAEATATVSFQQAGATASLNKGIGFASTDAVYLAPSTAGMYITLYPVDRP